MILKKLASQVVIVSFLLSNIGIETVWASPNLIPPIAISIPPISISSLSSKVITLNGADPSGGKLRYLVTPPPLNQGTLVSTNPLDLSNPDYVFSPANGFLGTTSFTYKVNDGLLDSNVVTVSVNVMAPPTISSLTAASPTIIKGQSTSLTWVSSGATSLSIDSESGDVTGSTSVGVCPAVTTTYTLTATNAVDSTTKSVTVTVNNPTNIIHLTKSAVSAKTPVGQPYILDQANAYYQLDEDLDFTRSAFVFGAANVILDFNGHTVTYDDGPSMVLNNAGFEDSTIGDTNTTGIAGWDFSGLKQATASVVAAGIGYYGKNMLQLTNIGTATETFINTTEVSLKANVKYTARAIFRGPYTLVIKLSIIDATTGNILSQSTINSGSDRGYALFDVYTPTTDTKVKLMITANTTSGPSNLYVDEVKLTEKDNHGILASNASYYFPPQDSTAVKNAAVNGSNSTLLNGKLIQGKAASNESEPIYAVGPTLTVNDMEIYANGDDENIIDREYSGNLTVVNCKMSFSLTMDIWDRMVCYAVIGLSHYSGVILIAHNTFLNPPQEGVFLNTTDMQSRVDILNNTFTYGRTVGFTNDEAIMINEACNVMVRGNTITGNIAGGWEMDTTTGDPDPLLPAKGGNTNITFKDNNVNITYGPNREYGWTGLEIHACGKYRTYSKNFFKNILIDNNTCVATTGDQGVHAAEGATFTFSAYSTSGVTGFVFSNNHLETYVTTNKVINYSGYNAWGMVLGTIPAGGGIKFLNNTLKSNDVSLQFGDQDNYQSSQTDVLLDGNVLVQGNVPGVARSYTPVYMGASSTYAKNASFFNTTWPDGLPYHAGDIYMSQSGYATIGSNANIGSTASIRVYDTNGSPAANAAVNISDKNGTTVYSGVTETSGSANTEVTASTLTQSNDLKTITTDLRGPFTVQATLNGITQTQSADFSSPQLVTFDFSGKMVFPPSIITQPIGQSINTGQTATFNVAASGTAPLTYQWQKNGSDISGAVSASYTTPATTLADSGAVFTCVVTNGTGHTTSNSAILTVSNSAPITPPVNPPPAIVAPTISSFTASPSTITQGESTSLSWSATGSPTFSIDNGIGTVSGTSQSVSPTQTTTYKLTASNSAGTVSSSPVTITVNPLEPRTTLMSENFDSTALGQIPSNWTSYLRAISPVSYPLTIGVSSVRNTSGKNSLEIKGGLSADTARAWYTPSVPADAQVNANVYLGYQIGPTQIIARGSNLNTTTPTFYAITLDSIHNPTLNLIKIENGKLTTLATVKAASYLASAWTKMTFDLNADHLRAQVVRLDTTAPQYLTAGGVWQTAQAWAIDLHDASIVSGGNVGIGNANSYVDDFNTTVKATVANTAPTISSFVASSSTITVGQSTTLSWSATGTPNPSYSIDNAVGIVTGTSVSVSPTKTTTYTLTADNGVEPSATKTVTVTVNPANVAPSISSFSASSSTITAGQSTNLSWSVTDGYPTPTTLSINNGIGVVTGTSLSVSPTETTSYTLTATNSSNLTATKTITVVVNAAPDTTPPSMPSGLVVTPISNSQINLSWKASTDNVKVTGYKVYRDNVFVGTSTLTSFSDTGLTGSTAYMYTVSATDAAGNESNKSASESAMTLAPPSLPSISSFSANATSISYGQSTTLSWAVTPGVPSSTKISIDNNVGDVSNMTSVSVSPTQTTTYKLTASNTTGSVTSVPVTVTVNLLPDTTPPLAPGLSVTAKSSSQIDLLWNIPSDPSVTGQVKSGIAGFKVYRDSQLIKNINSASATSYSDTVLDAATSYSYSVTAYDAAGNESLGSATKSVTTLEVAPLITSFSASSSSILYGQSTNLSWVVTGTNPKVLIDNVDVTGNSKTVSPTGTTTYTLSASNSAGSVSSKVTITVNPLSDNSAPSVPQGLVAVASSANQINLRWDASTDPSVTGHNTSGMGGYKIFRDGTLLNSSNTPSFVDTTVMPATSYSYTILAYDAAGNSSVKSSPVNVSTPDSLPVITSFGAGATNINAGQSTDLSWTVSGTNLSLFIDGTAVSGNTITVSPNQPSVTYTLTAKNSAGVVTSAVTVNVNADPVLTAQYTPVLSATASSYSQVSLSWNASTNPFVVGYKILRNGIEVGTSTSSSYSDTGLSASTTYTYQVYGFDGQNNKSALSAPVVVTTLKAPSQRRG